MGAAGTSDARKIDSMQEVAIITMNTYQSISEDEIAPSLLASDSHRGGGYCVVIRREDGADICTQRMCEHTRTERLQTATGGDI